MDIYHLDYETRSRADLRKVGAYKYAEHESTRIMLAGISKNDGPVYLWVNPEFESETVQSDPKALELLREGCANLDAVWYAWNSQFESAISTYRMMEDIGVACPAPTQWRCVAAMSRRAAMPSKLEHAARLLSAPAKDKKGSALINVFSKPGKTDGVFKDPRSPKLQQKFKEFGAYCVQDVVAEKALHKKLRVFEMKGDVLRTFQLDATINAIGIPVNVPALRNAQRILDEVFHELNERFYQLTGLQQSQNLAVKALLHSLGVNVENLRAETVKEVVLEWTAKQLDHGIMGELDMVDECERNLEILRLYSELNFAAAKKVSTMLACVCSDGRVRGTLLYHGAGTGRWSGQKIQPQNFKRPTIKDTAFAYKMICDGCSRLELELLFGNALEVIASCIRHFIHWSGGPMLDADYNAIEARIVCWLAGQENVLEMFRTGVDLYKWMAGRIYNKRAEDIQNPSFERTVGKHTILGCGFAMWWPKFMETCEEFGVIVTEELAEKAVRAYRELCDKVVELWDLTEQAAKNAINYPGKTFWAGTKLRFCVATSEGVPYLVMTLPSKRNIVYPYPKLEMTSYIGKDKEGNPVERKRLSITFLGQLEGKQIWGRIKTYGGKLVENATQGTAADFMSNGASKAMDRGFEVPALIHDQALALKHLGHELAEFIAALVDLPEWAEGCPIKCEGKVVPYYTKT